MKLTPGPGETRPHISPSWLRDMEQCGQYWLYKRVERRPYPASPAMHRGTGAHAAIQADLAAKRDTGDLLPLEAVREAAAAGVEAAWNRQMTLVTERDGATPAEARGRATDTAIAAATAYHEAIAPTVQPAALEERVRVELLGYPVDLLGIIDVREQSGAIRDTKTTGKRPDADAAERSLQLTAYALARRALTGAYPPSVHLDHLVVGKKQVEPVTQSAARGDADARSFLLRVERALQAVEREVFLPAPEGAWNCSQRW